MLKLLTFKTNQTILGEVTETLNSWMVKQPVQVIVQPTKEGPMMGFSPYLEFAEEFKTGIDIPKDVVQSVTTPIIDLSGAVNLTVNLLF